MTPTERTQLDLIRKEFHDGVEDLREEILQNRDALRAETKLASDTLRAEMKPVLEFYTAGTVLARWTKYAVGIIASLATVIAVAHGMALV